jgi:DNA-directed RNA polymerase subunit RPC12/RpoP
MRVQKGTAQQQKACISIRDELMPFVFFCSRCGSVLYEDPSPMLQDGSYKSPSYFERILNETGINCPACGHELHIPPTSIEVFAPTTDRYHKKTRNKKNQTK